MANIGFAALRKLVSTTGSSTAFTRTDIGMDYTDSNGNIILKRFLAWEITSPDTLI